MQREMNMSYWKRYILVAVCAAFAAFFAFAAVRVDAASVIPANSKANAKYSKKAAITGVLSISSWTSQATASMKPCFF